MRIRLVNARRLAIELGRGEVSSREKAYYLFAGFVAWTVVNYAGIVRLSPLWSWFSLVEGIGVGVITLLGFSYAYEAAGDDGNTDFVAQFTCLYLPVSVTTALAVWACYWVVDIAFRESIIASSQSHWQFAVNLSRAGGSVFDALTIFAVLVVQGVTFFRMTKLFEVVTSQRATANLSLQPTPASGRG